MRRLPGSCHDLRLILSLNFFGTISIIKGAYDLLEKKGGSCVATVSNAISQGDLRMDLADILNNNNEDELRILDLVSNLDENDLLTGNRLYVASKYALARWVAAILPLMPQWGSHQRSGTWKRKHIHDCHYVCG